MRELEPQCQYFDTEPTHGSQYLLSPIMTLLRPYQSDSKKRLIEIGCGNGFTASVLSKEGFHVLGIDPSKSGISLARSEFPSVEFDVASVYDGLKEKFGTFPIAISLEAIEHCFSPRAFINL